MNLAKVSDSTKYFARPIHILRNYRLTYLRPDFIAALTVAVVLIPQAIAYALIAELPPQTGLYAAIIASVVTGLWGSSNQMNTGPANTISLLVLSALLAVATPGTPEFLLLAGILAVMVGVISLLLGIARLGVLVNFVSDSVIVGFTAGAGILIATNQFRHLLRLNVSSSPELAETLQQIGIHLPESHWPSFFLGFGSILLVLILHKINPRIPGPLIVIVSASVLVVLLGLENQGVTTVGKLPQGLPPINKILSMGPDLFAQLSTKALTITAIALIETISIARSIASQTRQRLESNQEFVGQGLANIASGLFSGYPVAGSFIRSAVNFQSGAHTSISSVFAGLIVLLVVLTLGGFAGLIPLPALAGVLIIFAISLIDKEEILRIWHGPSGDRLIMVVTFLATILIPLEFAVVLGILLSVGLYLLQTSTPGIRKVLPDQDFEFLLPETGKEECPQLSIVEIMGDLYFGAVHHIEEYLLENQKRNPNQRYLLLRMNSVDIVDISGIHALESIVDAYRERNGDVFVTRFRQPIFDVMQSSGFSDFLGDDHFLSRDRNAIGHLFYKILDPAVCIYECPIRAFKECQNLPKRLDIPGYHLHADSADCDITYIEPEVLWKELHTKSPPYLIDVREPREYSQGHIPQAQLLPLPALIANPSQLPDTQSIVLICRSGRRSERAACYLTQHGVDSITALRGGMIAWEANKLFEAVDLTPMD
jgi:SulP family sulfate permease